MMGNHWGRRPYRIAGVGRQPSNFNPRFSPTAGEPRRPSGASWSFLYRTSYVLGGATPDLIPRRGHADPSFPRISDKLLFMFANPNSNRIYSFSHVLLIFNHPIQVHENLLKQQASNSYVYLRKSSNPS